jgi:hypothetical protein
MGLNAIAQFFVTAREKHFVALFLCLVESGCTLGRKLSADPIGNFRQANGTSRQQAFVSSSYTRQTAAND